jgi:hypothetical protein
MHSAFIGEPLNGLQSESKNVCSIAPDIWQIERAAVRKVARKKRFRSLRAWLAQGAEINLSPERKKTILAAYHDSNQKLAAALDIDLKQYGYCGTSHAEGRWIGG